MRSRQVTRPRFGGDHKPRLAFDLTIRCHRGRLSINNGEFDLEIRGLPPLLARDALDEMRGDRSVDEIASRSGLPIAEIESLCSKLSAAGILTMTAEASEKSRFITIVSPAQLVDGCEVHYAQWKSRLFSRPLWTQLATGDAPRQIFLGWLIENYFFIEAATQRLPLAVAGTHNPAARRLFSKHFSEEFDHHHFFSRALAAAGLDAQSLAGRKPLPSTRAICDHMRECGRRDPLAYAACSGFLESTGDDHHRAHIFFDLLTKHFDGENGAVIKPLADHARLDEGYQHCGMLRLIADAIGPVPVTRAESALESARLLVETLEVWSDDIRRHYGNADALKSGIRRYRPPTEEYAYA